VTLPPDFSSLARTLFDHYVRPSFLPIEVGPNAGYWYFTVIPIGLRIAVRVNKASLKRTPVGAGGTSHR
jgi:hypothetical protein